MKELWSFSFWIKTGKCPHLFAVVWDRLTKAQKWSQLLNVRNSLSFLEWPLEVRIEALCRAKLPPLSVIKMMLNTDTPGSPSGVIYKSKFIYSQNRI